MFGNEFKNITTVADLNQKVWFRALKVIYYSLYLLAVSGIIVGVFIYDAPSTVIDNNSSLINCDNKRSYTFTEVGEMYRSLRGSLFSSSDKRARRLCAYGLDRVDDEYMPDPGLKNYTISVKEKRLGGGRAVLLHGTIGITFIFLLFEVIKRVSLYILIGRKIVDFSDIRPKFLV